MLLEKNFQLQSCSKFVYKQLCNWKFGQNIASLAVAREVRLQVGTIAKQIPGGIDQIIASLCLEYFCDQMISLGVTVSSSFTLFALNCTI